MVGEHRIDAVLVIDGNGEITLEVEALRSILHSLTCQDNYEPVNPRFAGGDDDCLVIELRQADNDN